MNNLDTFVAAMQRLLPEQAHLVSSRAEALKTEPMRLLKEFFDRSMLTKARICQLWADSLGVAYVNPMSVAIPTDEYEQLPVDIARDRKSVV